LFSDTLKDYSLEDKYAAITKDDYYGEPKHKISILNAFDNGVTDPA
jgi:hypothetical protein